MPYQWLLVIGAAHMSSQWLLVIGAAHRSSQWLLVIVSSTCHALPVPCHAPRKACPGVHPRHQHPARTGAKVLVEENCDGNLKRQKGFSY